MRRLSQLLLMYQSNRSFKIARAYPGHLTPFPTRERGNLMNLVFPGVGHLIITHRGWGIWPLASISCYESHWFHVGWSWNHDGDGGDKLIWIQRKRLRIHGGLVENQRPAQAMFRTPEIEKTTRLRLVVSPTLLSCSTSSCLLYNRTAHSGGFFSC